MFDRLLQMKLESRFWGAASIEWFDRWVRTGDTAVKQRIRDYNEDDCVATRVVLDRIRDIALASP